MQDEGGTGIAPCPPEDPGKLSTAVIVLSWVTFMSAAATSGMLDAAERMTILRRSRMDDALMKG